MSDTDKGPVAQGRQFPRGYTQQAAEYEMATKRLAEERAQAALCYTDVVKSTT